ncbi:AMP-binding protein [Chitinimonas arctica]|uniref:AMP-binding protein n=1 Tax=Chitinimonas arctica TaxID=2594795 RepID=A0A516SKQ5_9NEIS|nr:AMP-binding protein [Chitinimonas arctica]QDQ28741.1 AMP-binding protein [Chitinimonas arctica]
MPKHDPIALNARKQALRDFMQQQAAPEYRDCPFFAASAQPGAADVPTKLTFLLPAALHQRIFSMAAASALHRQSLFSACLKYLAFLHCREAEGVLAWQTDGHCLPLAWKIDAADLEQPVKRLFGSELALWRQAAELCSGLAADVLAGELAPMPEVLVAYAETGDPLEGVKLADYRLAIGIAAGPESTRLQLCFAKQRVDEEIVGLIAERFMLLLQGMAAEPAAPLGSMAWVPAAEQARITALSSPMPAGPLPYPNLAHAIAAALRTRPDRPFLQVDKQSTRFADLARYTDHLLADPAWPEWDALGDCILIVGPKGPETTLAALVCMRIGKPFCLQPDSQPEAQLDSVMAVHRTRVVLLEAGCAALAGFFEARNCQVLLLPALDEANTPAGANAAWLERGLAVEADASLCVVMTSGSEGQPKGCIATHRALLNLAQEKGSLYGPGRSRVASMSNHAFDYFVLECVEAMLLDVELVLLPQEARVDAVKCVRFLSEQGIDQLFATTVLAEDIMAQGEIAGFKQLFFGGESLRSFSKHNYQLFHVYGPSETGVLTSCAPIHANHQRITIGKPIGGYQCAIVFPGTVEPCPLGVPGELLIGGAGVGLGYLNRPDLTAKSFIDVDQTVLRGRFYRSGDICCWNAEGELEIQGRRDRQLKVNGFRVELDAIERCLCELPGVSQAAVIGLADQLGHARLGAVVAAGPELGEQQVRTLLAARLPAYMVPGQIARVAALPLNRNGKLDRPRLKALLSEAAAEAVVPPQGAIQNWLAACWARTLEMDLAALSVDRSFFALGGHSLRAARMLAELQQAYQVEVPLLEFFRNDSIASLAGLVEARLAQPSDQPARAFSDCWRACRRARRGAAPCPRRRRACMRSTACIRNRWLICWKWRFPCRPG